jgi:hypothetical protein
MGGGYLISSCITSWTKSVRAKAKHGGKAELEGLRHAAAAAASALRMSNKKL